MNNSPADCAIVEYDATSLVGRVRKNNEDMLLVDGRLLRDECARGVLRLTPLARIAAIVADGMGGADGGELASEIAAQEFDSWLAALPDGLTETEIKHRANDFAVATHALINTRGNALEGFHGMGTTLCGLFTYGGEWHVINVGDSRAYIYRDGILRQLTTDHSMRNLLSDPSQPSNLIYNALGGGDQWEVFADCSVIPIFPGDRLLICSDGLSDLVTDEQIDALMDADASAAQLADVALENGGIDNVSIILLTVGE